MNFDASLFRKQQILGLTPSVVWCDETRTSAAPGTQTCPEMLLMVILAKLECIYTVTVPGGHGHTFSSFMPFFIIVLIFHLSCFPGGSDSKEPGCNAGDPSLVPESGRSPGEGLPTHSSILVWRISWTEEPGGLQSMGSQRVVHD